MGRYCSKNLKSEGSLDVDEVGVGRATHGSEGAADVLTDEAMAVADAEVGPGLDGVGGVEVKFRTEKAAELGVASVGSRFARRGGTAGTAPRAAYGIEKIMGVREPEKMG